MEDWPKHKKPCKEEVAAAMKKKVAEEEGARIKAAREAVMNPPYSPACGKAFFETCPNCITTQREHWPVHKTPRKSSPIYKVNQELAARKKELAERQEETLGLPS